MTTEAGGLTLGLELMSMTCIQCINNIPNDADICSQHNYDGGSSKEMYTSAGAARSVRRNCKEGSVYVGESVRIIFEEGTV
jgi:hypothetical protein